MACQVDGCCKWDNQVAANTDAVNQSGKWMAFATWAVTQHNQRPKTEWGDLGRQWGCGARAIQAPLETGQKDFCKANGIAGMGTWQGRGQLGQEAGEGVRWLSTERNRRLGKQSRNLTHGQGEGKPFSGSLPFHSSRFCCSLCLQQTGGLQHLLLNLLCWQTCWEEAWNKDRVTPRGDLLLQWRRMCTLSLEARE